MLGFTNPQRTCGVYQLSKTTSNLSAPPVYTHSQLSRRTGCDAMVDQDLQISGPRHQATCLFVHVVHPRWTFLLLRLNPIHLNLGISNACPASQPGKKRFVTPSFSIDKFARNKPNSKIATNNSSARAD